MMVEHTWCHLPCILVCLIVVCVAPVYPKATWLLPRDDVTADNSGSPQLARISFASQFKSDDDTPSKLLYPNVAAYIDYLKTLVTPQPEEMATVNFLPYVKDNNSVKPGGAIFNLNFREALTTDDLSSDLYEDPDSGNNAQMKASSRSILGDYFENDIAERPKEKRGSSLSMQLSMSILRDMLRAQTSSKQRMSLSKLNTIGK